ncbi:MAG: apolipoprotein N-acyltransferase [Parachlamydia sp.]|nr:apolipoprotein N-acyltransferase [Parachlamydia sp.]
MFHGIKAIGFRFLLSLVIVGFGQPVWSPWISLLASICGYALFWSLILELSPKKRFWLSTAWMSLVQFIQLFWLTSHPFLYIYAVHLILSIGVGLQFGLIGLCLTQERLKSLPNLLAIAGLWTLMEWARLFLLAGYSLNPVGLALSAHLYSLQLASLVGVYGLSFWVILVNLLAIRAWKIYQKIPALLFLSAALLPFLYGFVQISQHAHALAQSEKQPAYRALLIQTAFPSEEALTFASHGERLAYVVDEWRQILALARKEWGKPTDLIALPEFVVPYGTYTPVFPYPAVKTAFSDIYGPEAFNHLPPLEEPLAYQIDLPSKGKMWFVNNAYWLQTLANLFHAEVVSGLEDAEDMPSGVREYYSAAVHVRPGPFIAERYEKRILMPMGEYIPFAFCRTLAAAYGIQGSFTHGKEAKVLGCRQPLGMCICYEETFGHLIRENSHKGAKILVNLTNDGWYPNSLLPQQHFDHARLRTVENGLPLLRSCNTGVTGAIDCFGRTIATLDNRQEAPGALRVAVPLYSYTTLYRTFGDTLIICISFASLLFFLRKEKNN